MVVRYGVLIYLMVQVDSFRSLSGVSRVQTKGLHHHLQKWSNDGQLLSRRRVESVLQASTSSDDLVGEAAAEFALDEQSLKSWGIFGAAVTGMLTFLYLVWMFPGGPGIGASNGSTSG